MKMYCDEAMVLPSSYAVMSEDEMTYTEGGIAVRTWMVQGGINVALGLLCGGVSGLCAKAAAGAFAKASARRLFAKKLAAKLTAKGIALSVASAASGVMAYVLTFVAGICDPGLYVANKLDARDGKADGWIHI